ncbi:MAG: hypothetical protein ACKOA1_11020 [Bacteroidota bacterium]
MSTAIIDWQLVTVIALFGLATGYMGYRLFGKKKKKEGCEKCND